MNNEVIVVGISGSLRKGSINTAVLRAAVALAPEGMTIEIADIHAIPIYNEDVREKGRVAATINCDDDSSVAHRMAKALRPLRVLIFHDDEFEAIKCIAVEKGEHRTFPFPDVLVGKHTECNTKLTIHCVKIRDKSRDLIDGHVGEKEVELCFLKLEFVVASCNSTVGRSRVVRCVERPSQYR